MKKQLGIILSVTMSLISCQNMPTTKLASSEDKNFNSQNNKFDDILQDKELSCSKEKGFKVKADIDDERSEENQKIIQENISKAKYSGPNINKPRFAENPPEYLAYVEVQREIDPKLRDADIEIIFKDEYKIRLKRMMKEKTEEEKKLTNIEYDEKINGKVEDFISLVDNNLTDIKKINDLFKKYNVIKLISSGSDESEEYHEKKYLEDIKTSKGISNMRSYYSFSVKDINIKEFIDNLRDIDIVKKCDIEMKVTNTIATPDPIFNNPKDLLPVSSDKRALADQTLRYMYSRIDAYKAGDLMIQNDITPKKIAVIDSGFKTDRTEDNINYDMSNRLLCNSTVCNPAGTGDVSYGTKNVNGVTEYDDHGEQVASVIASPRDNKGVTGIASVGLTSNPIIVPVKAEQTINSMVSAINKIVENRGTNKVKVICISRGLSEFQLDNTGKPIKIIKEDLLESNTNIRTAIKNAYDVGIMVVISAGNNGSNYSTESPSNISQNTYYTDSRAMVVGGTARFTNGRWNGNTLNSDSGHGTRIDIAAPADSIMVHRAIYPNNHSSYDISSGTSFSAPQVAAAAAIIMGIRNEYNLENGNSVDLVKNILFHSGTLIKSDRYLGIRSADYSGTTNYSSSQEFTPNGTMLNVANAIELAIKINPTKKYVRLFNTDYKSSVVQQDSSGNVIYGTNMVSHYKEDRIKEISSIYNKSSFSTYNTDCVYSWGYQVWDNGKVVFERVKGIAGKMKPLKILSPYQPTNNIISGSNYPEFIGENNAIFGGYNSFMNVTYDSFGYDSLGQYQGANIWFKYY